MFFLKQPTETDIAKLLATQTGQPFSYKPSGLTRNPPVTGYNIDHNRILLGYGPAVFQAARQALRAWKMFDLGWVRLFPDTAPITVGTTVIVRVAHLGFWSLNACRIVYVTEETGLTGKYGFAYGTLPEHGERGEERFMVEWNHEDDSVWYDILAISRPGFWATLGYPVTRAMQKRFAKDSLASMQRQVLRTEC